VIDYAKRHRGRTAQRFVDAAKIVEAYPQSHSCAMVFKLLLKPFVSRVQRRICIRDDKLKRST